jgi:hypothetical protein
MNLQRLALIGRTLRATNGNMAHFVRKVHKIYNKRSTFSLKCSLRAYTDDKKQILRFENKWRFGVVLGTNAEKLVTILNPVFFLSYAAYFEGLIGNGRFSLSLPKSMTGKHVFIYIFSLTNLLIFP